MRFEMDYNTFVDLEIFSSRSGAESLFTLFNRTRTEGGKKKLMQIMKEPTSNEIELSDRIECIKYFYEQQIQLNITYNQLDIIEHYLTFNKRYLRNNFLDALWDNLYFKINSENDYYIVTAGIQGIIRLLRCSDVLLKEFSDIHSPKYIKSKIEPVQKLLADKTVKNILLSKKKISCFQLNYLDKLFRKTEESSVKKLIDFIYEADVFEAVAEVAGKPGWCFPEYHNSEEVEITNLIHPGIEKPVSNSILLNSEQRLMFITGPNMGGKSSFLKAMGLAVYLAHIGFPVPAQSMRTPIFDGLITTINLPDNIHEGLSHYYSEIRRIKKTAEKLVSHPSLFIIFDELFRGTNVKDAYEASLIVISAISKIKRSKFLISSHLIELAEEIKAIPDISFRYFDFYFDHGKLQFTYTLKPGISDGRLGMYILNNEGVIDLLNLAIKAKG